SFIAVSHSLHYTGPHWREFGESQALTKPLRLATVAHPASSLIVHEPDAASALPGLPTESSAVLWNPKADGEVPSSLTVAVTPQPMMSLSSERSAEAEFGRMAFDNPKLAPLGFVRFCMRYLQDCAAPTQSSQPQLVPLTELEKAELEIVNRGVNHSIKPSD